MPEAVVLDAYSHEVSSAGFWPGVTEWLLLPLLLRRAVATGFDSASIVPRKPSGTGN